MDPERKNALIDLAELPGAGQHAAAVDEHRHAKCLGVLAGQNLRRSLRTAVERQRRFGRKIFGNAAAAETGDLFPVSLRLEPIALWPDWNCRQFADRIDAA